MNTVCEHCNLAIHCQQCIQAHLRALDEPEYAGARGPEDLAPNMCDFDECPRTYTVRRDGLQLCAQHATEHAKLVPPQPKHALQVVLEAGFDAERIRSYSGRGMFGVQCLAVTGTFQEIMAGIVYALLDEGGNLDAHQRLEVRDALEDVKMDSMGRDTIVYFPDATYVASEGT